MGSEMELSNLTGFWGIMNEPIIDHTKIGFSHKSQTLQFMAH